MDHWRTALDPQKYPQLNVWKDQNKPALAGGRWDGGLTNNDNEPNTNNVWLSNNLVRNMKKPGPACLVRPAQFLDIDSNIFQMTFTFLVKYHATIEVDMYDMPGAPIFLNPVLPNSDWWELWDVFAEGATENNKPASQQWSGRNFIHYFGGPTRRLQEI